MPHDPRTFDDDTARLSSCLIASGQVSEGQTLVPLSGGRTNRIWRCRETGAGSTGDLVIKLYATAADNPLFANDPKAEAALLRHLETSGLAPRLHSDLDTPMGHVLIYHHVAGTPWRHDPVPVANALAELHQFPVPPGLVPAPNGSHALLRQGMDILDRCRDTSTIDRLRRAIPTGSVDPVDQTCLLHGDVVPGNIILGPDNTLTLIDWQCPAFGDPLHDLAMFLSPAMQHVYRGAPLSLSEEATFLKAYGNDETRERYRELAPWFHWRMATYCLWRQENGAIDYAAGVDLELARVGAPA